MSLRLLVVGAAFVIAACDQNGPSPAPAPSKTPEPPAADTSAATAGENPSSAVAPAARGHLEQGVNMLDACDGETFNAAIGPGTCVSTGGMKFDRFIALLTQHGTVGPWRFSPGSAKIQLGDTFVAVNKGGEEHTFTEVEEFGGGIVPQLNDLAHTPTVAPECTMLDDDDFVPPGGVYREQEEDATPGETLKYQCCIHPWMRLEAHVSQ
jgi:hypothetical protein